MKTLFIRSICPQHISYGSDMRSGHFVNFLNKRGQVDLMTLTPPAERADNAYIKNNFKSFYYFDQKMVTSRLSALEKLTGLLPWQLTEYYSKDIQEKIGQIVEKEQYDFIFIFKLNPVLFFLRLSPKWRQRTIVDFDDMLSDLYLNHYKNIFTAYKNSFSLKFYEHESLKDFNRVFVCSKDAVSRIPSTYHAKVGIVPNIFPVAPNKVFKAPLALDQLLFVGSLDYFPNAEGLKWFFDLIWPAVKKHYPSLKLNVVGKSDEKKEALYAQWGKPQDVAIEVNVPSVSPYYENCAMTITPLLNGSGTRLKILESMAYGRPVITTLKGMEGLDFEEGRDLFTFKDTSSFIRAYESLLDHHCYQQTTAHALKVLEDRYSPKAFESNMEKNWESLQGLKTCPR